MTTEEKIQAYEEAVERIRKLLKNMEKEKALIEMLSSIGKKNWKDIPTEKMITWLEKQGSQRHTDNVEPKFKVGDTIINIYYRWDGNSRIREIKDGKYIFDDGSYIIIKEQDKWELVDKVNPKFKVGDWVVNQLGDVWHIDSFDKKNYQVSDEKGNYNYFPIAKQCEMRHWTLADAKDGDVLACNEEILLFKSYSVQGRISLYCWYNGQTNNFHSKEVSDTLLTTRNKICPATKEQRNLLFQKMKETGYEYDAEKKELKNLVDEEQIKKNLQDNSFRRMFEQKPADKVEPKFKAGDWIISSECTAHISDVKKDTYGTLRYYLEFSTGTKTDPMPCFIDPEYRLWTIEDAKNGDVLYSLDSNRPFIYKVRNAHEQAVAYCGLNTYGKFFVWDTKDCVITLNNYVPSTKEQRDLLFQKMKDAGYTFDFEKKELKKIEHDVQLTEFEEAVKDLMNDYRDAIGDNDATIEEVKEHAAYMLSLIHQNFAWSEEDEERIKNIISVLDAQVCWNGATGKKENPYQKEINWLKSLKPQNIFKTSEEQIQCLHDAIEHYQTNGYPASKLTELYEQMSKIYKL